MTSSEPLVTILIPCYNAMPYLPEALDSALGQTFSNLEILCINDGSKDETGKILEEYATHDNRIKVLHNTENLKLIKTLNKGIGQAKGDYIARMDADDVVDPNWIWHCIDILRNTNAPDVISCYAYQIDRNGKTLRPEIIRQTQEISCFFASFFYVPIHHGSVVTKTSILRKYLFLEEDHALHTEDYELFARMLRTGIRMRNFPGLLYKVRINPNSVSQQYTDIQNENFIKCVKIHFESFFQSTTTTEIMRVFANRITKNIRLIDMKRGIREISRVRKSFLNSSRYTLNKQTKKEINIVNNTHLFNVCWQSIKIARWPLKLYGMYILIIHSFIFLNKTVLKYLVNKI